VRPEQSIELTEMTGEECARLLSDGRVGRLGVIADGELVILPVNYVYDGEAVVFRTDAGLKLQSAPQRHVAFEVDDVDEETGTGWSVLIRGYAREITRAIDRRSEALLRLPVTPFAPGEKSHWIEIVPETVTGRRLESITGPAFPAE
jgi:nitroimidazol reductase NimA-like FMN-containing flavoprotein (pyridoxamine 5'-phosphate oxidase superfamily)